MARFQSLRRSDEEWFKLINEWRRSGLSDSLWCKQQGIPASSFFCAVHRLREKAYALPEREHSIDIVSNPRPCQDVVRTDIEPNPLAIKEPETLQVIPSVHLATSYIFVARCLGHRNMARYFYLKNLKFIRIRKMVLNSQTAKF